MYRNSYVSGLVGSDATALPATPSSATTRTHNQLQSHFPASTVATAALQNHRDDPHLAGNEACLCSSCHIKDRFFPRSQDGRIVLPPPSISVHSSRHHRATASVPSASAPLATSTRRRNRTDSTASNRDLRLSVAKFNEGRRGAGSRTDKGEGSSTGPGQISGNIEEVLPYKSREESLHTPQMSRLDELEGRPFSGPARRTQHSKKHDHKPKRPDASSWILESEELSSQSSHLSQPSSSSQHKSRRTQLELFLDKHGTVHPQNLPLVRELSPQRTQLEIPRSTTPSSTPRMHIGGGYGYERGPPSPPHQDMFDVSMSHYPEAPGRKETSQHHHVRHHSASRRENLTDVTQEKPKIIKFSSRSENPQPDNNLAPTTSGEGSVNSSPTRELPPSSHLPPSQIEDDSSSTSLQTQFRFQEPVVPEADPTSPIRSRDLSIVQVKWDSERKRRQGYFAQEEGTEKSPFRHYNKANCDFEG